MFKCIISKATRGKIPGWFNGLHQTGCLNVYVNIATGNIAGIEEQKKPGPSAQTSETPRWHPVISFMGSGWSPYKYVPATILETFTIRGEKWRVQYLSSADAHARDMSKECGEIGFSDFNVSIFFADGEKLSVFECSTLTCNKTQHIYRGSKKGADRYYFEVAKAHSIDWWELLVEDYY